MRIEFIAHATFVLTLSNGRRIILDPYEGMAFGGAFNYPAYPTRCDVAAITHDHADHAHLGDLSGDPIVVRDRYVSEGLRIESVRVCHDKFGGEKFGGAVDMKVIEAEGLRICHMGDCGELPSEAVAERLRPLDLLLVPVGGFYTIDGTEAADWTKLIRARTTIPCHYRTSLCQLPIEDEARFLLHFEQYTRLEDFGAEVSEFPEGIVLMPSMYR